MGSPGDRKMDGIEQVDVLVSGVSLLAVPRKASSCFLGGGEEWNLLELTRYSSFITSDKSMKICLLSKKIGHESSWATRAETLTEDFAAILGIRFLPSIKL